MARCSFTPASASEVAKARRNEWKSTRFETGVSVGALATLRANEKVASRALLNTLLGILSGVTMRDLSFAAGSIYSAAEVALSYHRRLAKLLRYISNGQVELL